jgi:hypothetical protein
MPYPPQTRLGIPAALAGFLIGTVLGLATFSVAGLLWFSGAHGAAATAADTAVLGALVLVAATLVLGQPARRRRARVPINRALPPQWWPREGDSVPVIAACIGGPLITGAGVALILFR